MTTDAKSNGCGDDLNWWLVPDFFPKSCEFHDHCYETSVSQEICDAQFYHNMVAEGGILMLPIAILYFVAVSLFGWRVKAR